MISLLKEGIAMEEQIDELAEDIEGKKNADKSEGISN